MSHQVRQVGDPWQSLTNDKLKGDRGEEQDEAELKSVLGQVQFHGESTKGKTADEKLKKVAKKLIFIYGV